MSFKKNLSQLFFSSLIFLLFSFSYAELDERSPEEIKESFFLVKQTLDLYRYQGAENTIEGIVALLESSVSNEVALSVREMSNKVMALLQDLQIYYHDIQHTLEVVLGTTRAVVEAYVQREIRDEKLVLLAITAALFHDIGYSNATESLAFLKTLEKKDYESLFCEIKGPAFVASFETLLAQVKEGRECTGAEFHLHHVYLGQLRIKHILQDMSFPYKSYLLQEDSLMHMGAMISLTDIKSDSLSYREKKRAYLQEQELSLLGEALETADLYTQLSTADRLKKGLALYEEFFIGKDDSFWTSGLSLIATMREFYQFFAKKTFSPAILNLLQEHFKRQGRENPYEITLDLMLFLHSSFESIYAKLQNGQEITKRDLAILSGLKENGLHDAVFDLFLATKTIREGKPIEKTLLLSLQQILDDTNSVLEIALGDEVRVTLMLQAALEGNKEEICFQFSTMRKPLILETTRFEDGRKIASFLDTLILNQKKRNPTP